MLLSGFMSARSKWGGAQFNLPATYATAIGAFTRGPAGP
jgi:hypothetical protein